MDLPSVRERSVKGRSCPDRLVKLVSDLAGGRIWKGGDAILGEIARPVLKNFESFLNTVWQALN